MEPAGWKETVRFALKNLPKHVRLSEMADELGMNRSNIYSFISKGTLNANDIKKLEDWLIKHGYATHDNIKAVADTAHQYPLEPSPWLPISSELRAVADVLDSPLIKDINVKAGRLSDLVELLSSTKDEFVREVEKQQHARNK